MVSPQAANISNAPSDRPLRYTSHALVDCRRFRAFPFFAHSAVLLDISDQGFKIEFTGEVKVNPGERFWLKIPLGPLGIQEPCYLTLRGEVRWYDARLCRTGGVFLNVTPDESKTISKVVSNLHSKR
jgi:hypothetical protein